ncbi:DNA-binding LytR/AlgR family response regulator [Peptoniphilus ivorii]|uniref:LytTR family DNA-binding domain-containing protein n=1 Tax=Aedoeadaptatus ivorii TaxID=54006 RepID=UPI0027847477|nr:LytTR family DNA-binding domain-containing protein [Peptoniphilus ivorii]MDQ0509086.1 DNA-binding LytR/AlgR family response regulator [Peptoniphilus ivorii]
MKAEIKIDPDCITPHAVIYAATIDEEVQRILKIFTDEGGPLSATSDDRIYLVEPEDVLLLRVEGGKTQIVTKNRTLQSPRRLYELHDALGRDFVRISKSAVVNLNACESMEATWGGMMLLYLKNGESEYISRHYLPAFKKRLGL